jgi:hypothetical protein
MTPCARHATGLDKHPPPFPETRVLRPVPPRNGSTGGHHKPDENAANAPKTPRPDRLPKSEREVATWPRRPFSSSIRAGPMPGTASSSSTDEKPPCCCR